MEADKRDLLFDPESTEDGDHLVQERLEELEEILRAVERLLQRFLASEEASRAMLKFLSTYLELLRPGFGLISEVVAGSNINAKYSKINDILELSISPLCLGSYHTHISLTP